MLNSTTMPASAAATVVRSSLEEMLESLRRRDEKPKDALPVLPSRPQSRGRLPSTRRSLPVNFKNGNTVSENLPLSEEKEREDAVLSNGVFENKRVEKAEQTEVSPYAKLPELQRYTENLEEDDVSQFSAALPNVEAINNDKLWSGEFMDHVFRKKLRVWCQFPDIGWVLGEVQSLSGKHANFCSGGKICTVDVEKLLPANPDVFNLTADLIQLRYINEPSVMYNLKCRYTDDLIYTKAGPILVSVNPFKKVQIHESNILGAYRNKTLDEPHVYAVVDTAFSEMMRDGINQSIIISGESAAGKTETAKIAMQYLATLGSGCGVEYKILHANHILEAFGNAKTSRNDNSSRFSKLIEIQFSETGRIFGAKIQTFLLEKSRVVQRTKGERSYHIFYQLCAGASLVLKDKLKLKSAHEYEYLKQSECLCISDADDAQMFHKLLKSLDTVHICKEDQEIAFAMLSVVLWLGNVKFKVIDSENHVQATPDEGLINAARLMGCESHKLMLALSTRTEQADNGSIVQRLTLQQAIDSRDALAKSIYASLFEWLVDKLNISLEAGDKGRSGKCINILDISGLESVCKNSFELFCINHTNERLQQHIHRHLFKVEQEEYTQDGIDWSSADFNDNNECLNTFEKVQLFKLIQLLETTTPHFIRCIKPNSKLLPGMFENDIVIEQLKCCGVLEAVRISRSGYPTRFTHQQFAKRYGFLLLNDIDFQDPLSISISVLHQFNILPEMYQIGYTKLHIRLGQLAVLENARKNAILRIIWVQRKYRGLQAHRHFQQLKQAVIILQTFTRGYLARKNFLSLKRKKSYTQKFNGWDIRRSLQGRKDFPEVQALALALAEFQKHALQAETMLKQKEEECASLREKLHLSDVKRSEYDIKMKAKEELWQTQMTSLQMRLEASKTNQTPGRPDSSPHNHDNYDNYDLGDGICTTTHTPDTTPPRHLMPGATPLRDYGGNQTGLLAIELQHQIQAFENDAQIINQLNPEEDLRKLKARFYAWKKDFKARLSKQKAVLRKSGISEGDKNRKRWWVKRAIRL